VHPSSTIASVCLFLVVVLVAALTLPDYGMGWDEIYRWQSGDVKLNYYETVWEQKSWSEARAQAGVDHYPGLFDLSLAFVHRLVGGDRLLLGHCWSFLFGFIGLMALWGSGRLLESNRLAFWACLFLVLTPPFYGHWFHNPKDIPFAAMTTVALAGSIGLVRKLPVISWKWVLVCGLAIGLAMATRIAGLVVLCYLAAALTWFFALSFLDRKRPEAPQKLILKLCLVWAGVMVLSWLILLPWWPAAHGSLFTSAGQTLGHLHDRAASIPLLFRGEVIDAGAAPRYYALWMWWIKTPESFLLLLLAAPFLAFASLRRQPWRIWMGRLSPAWLIVLLAGFFPLGYFTVVGPSLHDGVRHFLFVYPPLALVAAWSWLRLIEHLRRVSSVWIRPLYLGLIGLLLIQIAHLVALHPYQYTYYNHTIGGPSGAHGRYQTEYWLTAQTHAFKWLNDYWREQRQLNPRLPPARFIATGPFHLSAYLATADLTPTRNPHEADFFIGTTELMGHLLFEGEVLWRIERMGLPILEIRDLRTTTDRPLPES